MFFQRRPPTPKVIHLRGEPTKRGQDIQEQPQHVGELLQSIAPPAILLRLPDTIPAAAFQVVIWLWQERGFQLPPLTIERSHHFSLSVHNQDEVPSGHPYFTPTETAQLQLHRTIFSHLPHFLNRDYVLNQAPEIDPKLLNRLSKYLRALLQAGWTLPPPAEWPDLARAPFDEIASGLEPARTRIPLEPSIRTDLLFQALTEETTSPAIFQAIEEFWVASGQVFPEFQTQPQHLIRDLLKNPAHDLHQWARHTPDFEEQILRTQTEPAPTLARLTRLAILTQGADIEAILGPLPNVLATPDQQNLARRRLGP